MDSQCVQTLTLINLLPAHVWLNLEVDCPELGGSAPLSHILPPLSHQSFPLVFESSAPGSFCRFVLGSSGPEGSTAVSHRCGSFQTFVLLCEPEASWSDSGPGPGDPSVSGAFHHPAGAPPDPHHAGSSRAQERRDPTKPVQSSRRVHLAPHRHAERLPVLRSTGDRCSGATPASLLWLLLFCLLCDVPWYFTGKVRPLSELDCEVVWRPFFSSSSEGDLEVFVHEGNTQQLHCVAKVTGIWFDLSTVISDS